MKKMLLFVSMVLAVSSALVAEMNEFVPTGNGECWDSDSNWSFGVYPNAPGAEAHIGVPTEVKKNKGWRNVKIDENTVVVGALSVECGGWTNRITTGTRGDFVFDGDDVPAVFAMTDTEGAGLAMVDLDDTNAVRLASDVVFDSGSAPGDSEYGTILLKGLWDGGGRNFRKTGEGLMTIAFTNSADTALGKLQVEDGTLAVLDRIYAESVTKSGICRVCVAATNVDEVLSGPTVICANKVSVDNPELFVENRYGDVTNYGGFAAVSLTDPSSCRVYVPDANGRTLFDGRAWTNRSDALVSAVEVGNGVMTYSVYVPGSGEVNPKPEQVDSDLVLKLLDTGLELVTIITENGEEPTCDFTNSPPGCVGIGVIEANKVKGSLTVRDAHSVLYDSGAYSKGKSGMTVKVRGNTSAVLPKKGFKIKLQKDADLLCRGDDAVYSDSEWALLNIDEQWSTGRVLGLAFGFEINRILGFSWTPSFRYVNLVLNGDYRGIYVLIETVKRNPVSRICVDQNEGCLFEYDAYWWNEEVAFRTESQRNLSFNVGFTFKYPNQDDISAERIETVSNAVDRALSAVYEGGEYENFIDVDSWSLWLLGHDLMGILDGAGSNYYFTKDNLSETSRIRMSTMWDFDASFCTTGTWATAHTVDFFIFPALIANDNQSFGTAYRENWLRFRDKVVDGVEDLCFEIIGSGLSDALDRSLRYDAERWGHDICSTRDEMRFELRWFFERVNWIDAHIDELVPPVVVHEESEPEEFTPAESFAPATAVSGTGVYQGVVCDSNDTVVGVVQFKVGKMNRKTGVSAVSGSLTTLDGVKHAIAKVKVTASDTPSQMDGVKVKKLGMLKMKIGNDGFRGELVCDDGAVWQIRTEDISGGLSSSPASFRTSFFDSVAGMPVIADFLPLPEEVLTAASGKWKFRKGAAIRLSKGVIVGDDDPERPNLSSLKLTYIPKNGVFKGRFNVFCVSGSQERAKLKKISVKVSGVVAAGVGYGITKYREEELSSVVIR